MTGGWRTICAPDLATRLATWVAVLPGVVRVAVDGADCLQPARLAEAVVDSLRVAGRRGHHVPAAAFWHDASLRLEHGREDVESYQTWLDAAALRREVLDPARDGHEFLPALRDPNTNRSIRAQRQPLDNDAAVIVSGEFLLGRALPFERTVHLTAPQAALARRTHSGAQWTLAAHAEYDARVRPSEIADVVVRCDRRHPVVRGLPC